ncbi:hypothetical protein ACLOJK_034333 [Asimina triloba]
MDAVERWVRAFLPVLLVWCCPSIEFGREMLPVRDVAGDDRLDVTAMNGFLPSPNLEKTLLLFGFFVAWMVRRCFHWGRRGPEIDATITARLVQTLLESAGDHEDEVNLSSFCLLSAWIL